jgi:HPt (histidine-containing phosphotransfer) domain-containing protein
LRVESHRIRGGASNLTADRLADAADRLEVAAGDGDLEHAADAFEHMQRETKRLKQFVVEHCQIELPTSR